MTTRVEQQEQRRLKKKMRQAEIENQPLPVTSLTSEEKAKYRHFEVEMVVDLLYAAHAIRRTLDGCFDVPTTNEMLALRTLSLNAPYAHSGACFAEELGVKKQSAHELVGRLHREGYVENTKGIDARSRDIRINQRGVDAARAGRIAMRHTMSRVLAFLSPEEREAIAAAVRQLQIGAREGLLAT